MIPIAESTNKHYSWICNWDFVKMKSSTKWLRYQWAHEAVFHCSSRRKRICHLLITASWKTRTRRRRRRSGPRGCCGGGQRRFCRPAFDVERVRSVTGASFKVWVTLPQCFSIETIYKWNTASLHLLSSSDWWTITRCDFISQHLLFLSIYVNRKSTSHLIIVEREKNEVFWKYFSSAYCGVFFSFFKFCCFPDWQVDVFLAQSTVWIYN